jgi:hypothetical protein
LLALIGARTRVLIARQGDIGRAKAQHDECNNQTNEFHATLQLSARLVGNSGIFKSLISR